MSIYLDEGSAAGVLKQDSGINLLSDFLDNEVGRRELRCLKVRYSLKSSLVRVFLGECCAKHSLVYKQFLWNLHIYNLKVPLSD